MKIDVYNSLFKFLEKTVIEKNEHRSMDFMMKFVCKKFLISQFVKNLKMKDYNLKIYFKIAEE